MWELIIGLIVGQILGSRWGFGPHESMLLGTVIAVLAYLISCAWFPFRRCPWPWCPKWRQTTGDKRGNYRRRRPCRICGNEDYVRLGARFIARG